MWEGGGCTLELGCAVTTWSPFALNTNKPAHHALRPAMLKVDCVDNQP